MKMNPLLWSEQKPSKSLQVLKAIPFAIALMVDNAHANDLPEFVPPRAYDIQRYEAGWTRNPFTLRTDAVEESRASFAKDLSIASIYGDRANPTVAFVNIKTRERFLLKMGQMHGSGMRLRSVNIGTGRKDTTVQLALGAERSEVRYDSNYLSQAAAAAAGSTVNPAILQLRQQSLQQSSERPAPPIPNTSRQAPHKIGYANGAPAAGFNSAQTTSSQNLFAAGYITPQTSMNINDDAHNNQSSNNVPSNGTPQPSSLSPLAAMNGIPTRRFTFRTGNEVLIPHPDPQ